MAAVTAAAAGREAFLAAIEAAERAHRAQPAWVRALRRSAADAFGRMGIPTTRNEEWRFTNLAPVASTAFAPAPAAQVRPEDAARFLVPGTPGPVVVFVNGRYAPGLSRPGQPAAGLTVMALSEALGGAPESVEPYLGRRADASTRPFVALNSALLSDGAVVRVDERAAADGAVQIVFLTAGAPGPWLSSPRVLIVLGRGSQARVIETFGSLGGGATFTNAVTEAIVGDGAVLDHYRVQREGGAAFHVGHTQFDLGRSASSSSHAVALGARLARHDAVAVLGGEGAGCTLNGLYLAGGDQLVDNHTEIDHATPHGTSHEVYKGILGGRARGVFNGRIRVRPDAQKTDARQTNKSLLLSEEAQINTKPQLEILADDVKCTHGATVGQLNRDALFYLRARGIGGDEARDLLVRAFAAEVTDRVAFEPVRAELGRLLDRALPAARAGLAAA